MQEHPSRQNDLGLATQVNQTTQLDISGEQERNFKEFYFLFNSVKNELINAKQTLNDPKLSSEARVEKTLGIVQKLLQRNSLFNQNVNDVDEQQTHAMQDKQQSDGFDVVHDTIRKLSSQQKQFAEENKRLNDELIALKLQNSNYKTKISDITELDANYQQQLKNQRQKISLQIKKYQNLQHQFKKYIQDKNLSLQKLSQQKTQIQLNNSSLSRQNFAYKLQIQDLLEKNKSLNEQYQTMMINNMRIQDIHQDRPNELRNTYVNSLQQELLNLKDKKPSEDNEYFVDKLRGITEVIEISNGESTAEENQIIIELKKKISSLQLSELLLNQQNKKLNTRIQNLEMELKGKDIMIMEQNKKQKLHIQSKDTIISQMEIKLKQNSTQIQTKDKLIFQNDQNIKNLSNKYTKIQEDNSSLSQKIQNLQLRLKEAKAAQSSPSNEINTHLANIAALNQVNEQLNNQRNKYKEQFKQLRKANEAYKQQLKKFEHLKKPNQNIIYKLIQDHCNTLSIPRKNEFKSSLISVISGM